MLENISNHDSISNSQISAQQDVSKISSVKNKSDYKNADNVGFIDESNISNEALSLYEKDLDIKKFTGLVLSDPDDNSHNQIFAQKLLANEIELPGMDFLLNNKDFLADLAG